MESTVTTYISRTESTVTTYISRKSASIMDTPKELMDFFRAYMGGVQKDGQNQESWTVSVGEARLTFIRTW